MFGELNIFATTDGTTIVARHLFDGLLLTTPTRRSLYASPLPTNSLPRQESTAAWEMGTELETGGHGEKLRAAICGRR